MITAASCLEVQTPTSRVCYSVQYQTLSSWNAHSLAACMSSLARLLDGRGVAMVSQPASGRDASRRLRTKVVNTNHALGCKTPDVESVLNVILQICCVTKRVASAGRLQRGGIGGGSDRCSSRPCSRPRLR